MNDLKIKVCGMRDEANINAIAELPIDYLGFIYYEKSPRFVEKSIDTAILQTKSIQKVGVFVNADLDFVASKVLDESLDVVQLHGKETPQYITHLKAMLPNVSIWKVFLMDENLDFDTLWSYLEKCEMFLFDTKTSQHGGAGIKFDWSILNKYTFNKPFILAGGISESDIEVIKSLKIKYLYGLDLNSKFETAPAMKDVDKLKLFLQKLRA